MPFSPTLKERLRKKSKRLQVEVRNVFQNRSFFQKKSISGKLSFRHVECSFENPGEKNLSDASENF